MERLDAFTEIVVTIIKYVVRVLMGLMIVVVFSSAIARSLNISFIWSNDLSLLLFAWFAFLAMSLASYRESHPNVDLVLDKIPVFARGAVRIMQYIIIILFLFVIDFYTIKYAMSASMTRIATLNISFTWVSMSGVVGLSLMLLFEIRNFVKHLRTRSVNTDRRI